MKKYDVSIIVSLTTCSYSRHNALWCNIIEHLMYCLFKILIDVICKFSRVRGCSLVLFTNSRLRSLSLASDFLLFFACLLSIHILLQTYSLKYNGTPRVQLYIAFTKPVIYYTTRSIHWREQDRCHRHCIVLYCIYTFIQRFLQCTPIRSASSARDPERRAVGPMQLKIYSIAF